MQKTHRLTAVGFIFAALLALFTVFATATHIAAPTDFAADDNFAEKVEVSWSHGGNNPDTVTYQVEYADDCSFARNRETITVGSDTEATIPADPNEQLCVRAWARDPATGEEHVTEEQEVNTLANHPTNISLSKSLTCVTVGGEIQCFFPGDDPVQFITDTTEYTVDQLPVEAAQPWQLCGLTFRETSTGAQPLVRTCTDEDQVCNFRFHTSGFCQSPEDIGVNDIAHTAQCAGECRSAFPLQNNVPYVVDSSACPGGEDHLWFKIETEGSCTVTWYTEGGVDRLRYSTRPGWCTPSESERGTCQKGEQCSFTADEPGTYYAQIFAESAPVAPVVIHASATGENCDVTAQ